ncbi:TIGR03546 family protein [bacterium]|nr:TIGR03546 family protein [bacterium]
MFFLKPIRFLARALVQDNTPTQMALGFALGLMIGLVPKGNLIAISLMVVLGALRVNLGIGMLTAFAVSWLDPLVDTVTHPIGQALLTSDALTSFWTELYNMPVIPWTKFNNTIVLGSFVLGAVLVLPAFLISRPLFAKYVPDLSERLGKYRLAQLLLGTELAAKLS